jgi:hypothetical protein
LTGSPDRPRRAATIASVLPVLFVLLGAANAYRFVGYVCDDAVISFRSVQNWALGHGLVFNPGERLETFTNLGFVWLLAIAQALGFDLFAAAGAIGFACAVGALAATWWLARQAGLGSAAWAPLLVVALSTTLMGQAGTGLETTLCALLATLGSARALAECTPRSDGRARRPGVAMVLLSLAAMTRPDMLLVLGGWCVLKQWLLEPAARRRALTIDAAVAFALVAALEAFRFVYYGRALPNPVYAKVGLTVDLAVGKQGLGYLHEWLRTDFGTAIAAAGLLLAVGTGRRGQALAVLAAGWCLYVVASGGDHMPYSRFLAPMLPLIAVALAVGLVPLFAGRGRISAYAAILLALALAVTPLWEATTRGNIPLRNQRHETYRREIGEFFAGEAKARGRSIAVAVGAVGYIGYYGGDQVRIVDMLGLCDAHIARAGHRDASLLQGHQVGDGLYVLAQRPDFIVLGTTTPGDLWQQGDAKALLARIEQQGVAAWTAATGRELFVSERELLARGELFRDYAVREVTLPSGHTFALLQRRS